MDHRNIRDLIEAYSDMQEAYTVQGNARIGSVPAKATDKSVSGAVDKALANKGTAVSASSEKGKTGVTGGGSFKMSGSIGGGSNKPKPKPNPAPTGGRPTNTTPNVPNDSGRPTRPVRVQNPAADVRTTSTGGGGRGGLRSDTTSDLDVYNLVLEYLLDEGFASTEQSADKIILNMSESWFEEILEGREDRRRDRRQERGGVGGNVDYSRPPAKKATNAELGIPEMSEEEREKRRKAMSDHLKKMKR